MDPEELRDVSDRCFQKTLDEIHDKRWARLSAQQKAFLSHQELARDGVNYVLRENGSKACLTAAGDSIEVTTIWTDPSQRRQGHASKLLKRICELADKVGVELSLRAEPKDSKIDLNQGQLVAWYGRCGFAGAWNKMSRPPSQITE